MSGHVNEKKFTCIMCPLGCVITLKVDAHGNVKEIVGAKCKRGEEYTIDEFKHPTRILTTTVSIDGAIHSRLPVKTSAPIPKEKIFECMKEISKVRVKSPIRKGDAIIKNILNLNVDIIATRDL